MYGEAVALYLRLSKEDEDKKNQSESIINQRNLLTDYVENMNWSIYDIYIDDGFSGTNFERPDFKRLISQIEEGKIDTVITKDLSRLGRDYILTGYYLEKYFPAMGVRFIALNDGIDTANEDNGNNEISPFKSVINDMYAKDISKKVRSALMSKKKSGKFIGSFAPYGYKKDINDKGHLVIDEDTVSVVREIFKLYLEGNSLLGIARILTVQNIPTPSQTKNIAGQKRYSGLWNDVIIKRILTNETYTGNLIQNRSKKISYKVNKKVNLRKEDWIVIPKTHEGIISKDDFEAVQKILASKSYSRKNDSKTQHLLSGLVFCGDCGAAMSYIKESEKRVYLTCSTWRKYGSLNKCSSHSIRESIVIKVVLESLKEHINKVDVENIINKVVYENTDEEKYLSKELDRLKEKLLDCDNMQFNLYKDKTKGILSEEQFITIGNKVTKEINELNKQIDSLKIRFESQKDKSLNFMRINEFLKLDKIERHLLLLFIKRINILKNKDIEIIYNFKAPNK